MITTKWHQNTPFNNLCPLDDGVRCLTGCAATAMAQVMNYHQWPNAATTAIPEYKCTTLDKTLEGLPATTFDWANMINNYSGEYTSTQANAVATLMQYCGWSLRMLYGTTWSGSTAISVADALIKYFGYSKVVEDKVESTVQYVTRNFYSYANWTDLIYHELSQGRPVIYGGQSEIGGHCFVCDGYKSEGGTDLFHINWGWSGTYDGYFVLSVLNYKDEGGSSVTENSFNTGQEAIIGIQEPSSTGTVLNVTPNVVDLTLNSISLSSPAITLGKSVNVTISVTNNSEDKYDGDIALVVDYGLGVGGMFLIPPKTTQDCVITFKPASVGNYTIGAAYPVIGSYKGEVYLEGGLLSVVETDISLLDDDRSETKKNANLIDTWKGHFVSATLSGRTLWKDGAWNTLCLPFNVNDKDADIDDQYPAETGGIDDITFTGTPLAGAEARTLTSASLNAGTLTLNFSDPVTTIEAGKPYIIKWASGSNLVNPTFNGVTISSAKANVETTYIDFIGCTSPVTLTANDRSILFLGTSTDSQGTHSALFYPSADMTVNSCRGYFQLKGIEAGDKAGVKEFRLNLEDEDNATSIDNLQLTIDNEDSSLFTLLPSGQAQAEHSSLSGWFTLDGRKLSDKPTQHGIYILNGNKIAIK